MIASSLTLNAFTASVNQFVSSQSSGSETSTQEQILQQEREEKAAKIKAYYEKRNMPLASHAMKMVLEAEKHDVDWRMIPAIAVRESTGGKYACKSASYNPFGWGSCRISFKSYDHAIETLAKNLGGNNPNTDHLYDNKTNREILETYNPPSVVPTYASEVLAIMQKIGDTDI